MAICRDDTEARTGKESALIVKLRTHMPAAVWTLCSLRRHDLVAKKMPADQQSLPS
jgi:hypothetical protein